MSIPLYATRQGSMFKESNGTFFKRNLNGRITATIFGFDQIKKRYEVSLNCCDGAATATSNLTAFFPTIWEHPGRNVLIVNDSFGGERGKYDICCDNIIVT